MELRGTLAFVTFTSSWLVGVSPLVAQESKQLFDAPLIVGGNNESIRSLGDFTGDGVPDAISVFPVDDGIGGTTMWVRKVDNDGSGALTATWSTTFSPASILTTVVGATGRIDGDALDDFVVAGGKQVRVYTSAVMGPPVLRDSWQVDHAAAAGVIADFDADADGDVLLADLATLKLYTNPGASGAFAVTSVVTLPPAFLLFPGLIEADVNGDGTADVVATTLVTGGSGAIAMVPIVAGVIQPAVVFNLAIPSPVRAVSGDIDGDIDDDVVVFSPSSGVYQVLRRTGLATFNLEAPQNGGPTTTLADIDGDGDLDGLGVETTGASATLNEEPSRFVVSLNDGGGGFGASFGIDASGEGPFAIAADMDGDGDADLVGSRSIYFQRGSLTEDPHPDFTSSPVTARTIHDADDDGDVDFHAGTSGWLENDGDSGLTEASFTLPVAPAGTSFLGPGFLGDFDGDGDEDLIVGHQGSGPTFLGMRRLENTGGGGFVDSGPCAAPALNFIDPSGPALYLPDECLAADIDGDGDRDLVSTAFPGSTLLAFNDGTGFFATTSSVAGSVTEVVDLNGDGVSDLVFDEGVFRINAGGSFDRYEEFGFPAGSGTHAIADVDADGDLDYAGPAAVIQSVVGLTRIGINDGAASFTGTSPFVAVDPGCCLIALTHHVYALDANGDGRTDLLRLPVKTAPNAALLSVRRSDNSGYEPTVPTVLGPTATADVDGDGDVDVIGGEIVRNRAFAAPDGGVRRQYGSSVAGAAAMKPKLGATGPFRVGETAVVRLRGGAPVSAGLIVAGFTPAGLANVPLPGLTTYAFPFALVVPVAVPGNPAAPGSGALTLPFVVPAVAANVTLYFQAFLADPGGPSGATATNGLELHFGP